MTEPTPFVVPFALLVLVVMQYLSAFIAWRFHNHLLSSISNGVLSGAVVGVVFYQALPGAFNFQGAVLLALIVAITYSTLLEKLHAK
jgi:ABC-type Mn2+/Zn2+ transport system permease subunit